MTKFLKVSPLKRTKSLQPPRLCRVNTLQKPSETIQNMFTDKLPIFNFKAFPQPPPPSSTPSGVFSEYGDAKPPSLRPLDYDESSFLGEFGAAFDVPSTTTTEKPITRMIGVEPFFSKKKASRRPKFGSGSSTESRPHLEEILEWVPLLQNQKLRYQNRTSTRTAFKRPRTEKFNEELEPLPPPKSRNPHVASGGWQPMHPHKASGVFRIPTTTPMDEMAKVFLDYSNRKRHPVRVEMTGARRMSRNVDNQKKSVHFRCNAGWMLHRSTVWRKVCLLWKAMVRSVEGLRKGKLLPPELSYHEDDVPLLHGHQGDALDWFGLRLNRDSDSPTVIM